MESCIQKRTESRREMSEYHDMTLEEVLTEFAKRDSAGFIVCGQKLESAHKRADDQK